MIVVTTSRGAIGQRMFETVFGSGEFICVPGARAGGSVLHGHGARRFRGGGNAVGVHQITGETREAGRTGCGCPTPWQGSLLTW